MIGIGHGINGSSVTSRLIVIKYLGDHTCMSNENMGQRYAVMSEKRVNAHVYSLHAKFHSRDVWLPKVPGSNTQVSDSLTKGLGVRICVSSAMAIRNMAQNSCQFRYTPARKKKWVCDFFGTTISYTTVLVPHFAAILMKTLHHYESYMVLPLVWLMCEQAERIIVCCHKCVQSALCSSFRNAIREGFLFFSRKGGKASRDIAKRERERNRRISRGP